MPKLSENRGHLPETIMMYLLMVSYAVFSTLVGVVLTRLLNEFEIPLSDGGIFPLIQNLGCLAGILVSGFILGRHNYRRLTLMVFAGFTSVVLLIPLSTTLLTYLFFLLLGGFMSKFLDSTLNVSTSMLHLQNKGFYLSLLHCSFGIGAFIGPIANGKLLNSGVSWRGIYFILGLACLFLLACYALVTRGKTHSQSGRFEPPRVLQFKSLLNRRTIGLLLVIALYCGFEYGIGNWIPTFMTENLGSSTMLAASGLSFFWLGSIAGRLTFAFLTIYVREKTLIVTGCILGGLLVLTGLLIQSETWVIIGVAGAGFFASGISPITIAVGYAWYPEAQGLISMLMFMSISIGAGIFPWLIGIVAGLLGLHSALVINSLLVLLAGLITLALPLGAVKRKAK
ncbi:MAG: MFS transporter [Planctomycetota bacterium]|jgi:fucose permease|nr:MFS transporter [Planctomycetota bacterium]